MNPLQTPQRQSPGPFNDHEAHALYMLDKPLRHDLRHDLIGVVDTLAFLVAQGECERRRQSARVRLLLVGCRTRACRRSSLL